MDGYRGNHHGEDDDVIVVAMAMMKTIGECVVLTNVRVMKLRVILTLSI